MKKFTEHYSPKQKEQEPAPVAPSTPPQVINAVESNNPVFVSISLMLESLSNEIKNYSTKSEVEDISFELIQHIKNIQDTLKKELVESVNLFNEQINNVQGRLSKLDLYGEEESRKVKSFVYDALTKQDTKLKNTADDVSKEIKLSQENYNKFLSTYSDVAESNKSKINGLQKLLEDRLSEYKKHTNEAVSNLNTDLKKETKSLIDEAVKNFNEEVSLFNQQIEKQNKAVEELDSSLKRVITETKQAFNEEKYFAINQKILHLEQVLEKFNEKSLLVEGVLDAPPETKTSDPLTPLNQNFVTQEDLKKHYQLFINRVQQQLTSIGGGGAAWLKDLQDVNYYSVKNAIDGQALVYNAANALWEAGTVIGGTGGATSNVVYYGSFYDVTTQNVINISTATPVYIGQTAESNGVYTDGSNITVLYAGVYNIQFSAQLNNTGGGGGGKNVEIWLERNGAPVANTNTRVDVNTNSPFVVAAWNFLLTLNPNDRIQLYWHSDSQNIKLWHNSGTVTGAPDVPSVILTVVQEASVGADTGNVIETTNLYFTNARVYSNVTQIGYATNSNVALKSNVDDLTTANVIEVGNLYFTNARAVAAFSAGQNITLDANGRINSTATGSGASYTDTDAYSNVIQIGYATNANVSLKANVADLTTANVPEVGNLYFTNARVQNYLETVGNIIPAGNNIQSLGSPTNRFKDIYVSGNTIYLGGASLSVNGSKLSVDGDLTQDNVVVESQLTTANVREVSNLYHTNARVYANVIQLGYATVTYVDNEIANLINSAPGALDTLNELANALGNDANFATTITNSLATKANTSSLTTANVIEVGNLYFTNARVVSALTAGQNITIDANGRINSTATGGNNYTDANTYSNVQLIGYATNANVALKANVADLRTANVPELTNLYFTNARVYSNVIQIGYATNANVALKANIADLTTANVAEVTNLYFSNARVNTALTMQTLANATFSGNVTAGNLIATGNIVGNTNGFAIGYRDIPQVSFAANATIALSDAGKHYYSTSATNLVLTVANNSSQAFAIGAAINVINRGTGTITISPGVGVSVYLAGNTTSASRVVSSYGAATIQKVESDVWFIVGAGIA